MNTPDPRYAELVAALEAGLVKVAKHRYNDEWIYTVAGTFAQGAAATEHAARLEGITQALGLINRLLDEQNDYIDQLTQFATAQEDDRLGPFKRALEGDAEDPH